MKKRAPQRVNKPNSQLSSSMQSSTNSLPITQSRGSKEKSQSPTNKRSSFGAVWKDVWAYLGPFFTLVGVWAYWSPSLTITSGVNLDPSQSLQTQFVVTNNGHVPVRDVNLTCGLLSDKVAFDQLDTINNSLRPIAVLGPGMTASRGCFSQSQNVTGAILKIEAHYRWPIINRIETVKAFFSALKGRDGNYLVPEAPPVPEPQTLIRVN